VDVTYAAAPAGQVVGFAANGKVFLPVGMLAGQVLPAGLAEGSYLDGSVLHVLTRAAGRVALFRPGRWGDPRRVSARAPLLRRLAALRVTRQADRSVMLVTRLSTTSQVHLYATALRTRGSRPAIVAAAPPVRQLLLSPGSFAVRVRLAGRALARGALVRVQLRGVDPWGRSGVFTLSFRAP
jgi:hypothetical protein